MGDIVVLSNHVNRAERAECGPHIKPATAWREGWLRVLMLDSLRRASWWRSQIAIAVHGQHSIEAIQADRARTAAERAWEEQAYQQIFIAAPAVGDLRWKEGFTKYRHNPEVEAALERDRVALATQIAGYRKAAATRKANRLAGGSK